MARQRAHADEGATAGTATGGTDRVDAGLPRAEARARFGGVDPMAVLGGTMAATGTLLLLSSLAGALGRIGYEQGSGRQELSTPELVAGLLVLGLSLLFGGYVTGRVARYEGKRNGLLTGVAFAVLSALVAGLASRSDRVRDLDLPRFVDTDTLTVAALASAVTALSVAIGAAVLGGRSGAAYHRRVDDALLHTGAGGPAGSPADPDGTTEATGSR